MSAIINITANFITIFGSGQNIWWHARIFLCSLHTGCDCDSTAAVLPSHTVNEYTVDEDKLADPAAI